MPLPSPFEEAIEQARTRLEQHPRYELLPFYRARVYQAITNAAGSKATQIRGTLAILTVQHVLPIWKQERPDNSWPERLLGWAAVVLTGGISQANGIAEVERAQNQAADYFSEQYEAQPGSLTERAHDVLIAAVEALFEASGEYHLWDAEGITDASLDGTCADTAYWAWLVYAHPFWDPSYNPADSREFWMWWLSEAIPQAWSSIT